MSLRASVPASEAIHQFWRGDCFAKSARNDILRIAAGFSGKGGTWQEKAKPAFGAESLKGRRIPPVACRLGWARPG